MKDRDQDERRDLPGDAPPDDAAGTDAEDAPAAGPTPATWAGRQRSSGEAAEGQEEQPSDEEPDESRAEQEEIERRRIGGENVRRTLKRKMPKVANDLPKIGAAYREFRKKYPEPGVKNGGRSR